MEPCTRPYTQHPVLHELVELLPRPGESWSTSEAKAWGSAFQATLNLVMPMPLLTPLVFPLPSTSAPGITYAKDVIDKVIATRKPKSPAGTADAAKQEGEPDLGDAEWAQQVAEWAEKKPKPAKKPRAVKEHVVPAAPATRTLVDSSEEVDRICDSVCRIAGISYQDMRGPTKSTAHVYARLVMAFLLVEAGFSKRDASKVINRHETGLNAMLERVAASQEYDHNLHDMLVEARREINRDSTRAAA